jgi:hypothetical protein
VPTRSLAGAIRYGADTSAAIASGANAYASGPGRTAIAPPRFAAGAAAPTCPAAPAETSRCPVAEHDRRRDAAADREIGRALGLALDHELAVALAQHTRRRAIGRELDRHLGAHDEAAEHFDRRREVRVADRAVCSDERRSHERASWCEALVHVPCPAAVLNGDEPERAYDDEAHAAILTART